MSQPTIPVLLLILLALAGCSRVKLAYTAADLLLAGYAQDYLGLEAEQLDRWRPRLKQALAAHRRDELPHLAGYFDAALELARQDFPEAQTRCLVEASTRLYRRQARVAVAAAAPLLADLGPAQVRALGERFARDYVEDRPKPGDDPARERRKRVERYGESIAYWTGPLGASQQALVAQLAGRLPDTGAAVLAYRTRKRDQLLERLHAGAGAKSLERFLTDWLVDYRDLPPELEAAGAVLRERLVELVRQLGASLTPAQRRHLEGRLAGLREDLLKLQAEPRLVPPGCSASRVAEPPRALP
jgi:hypothetical protein